MHVVEWVILAVVVLGIVVAIFGWDRYRGNRKGAGGGSEATGEVFIDPASGQRMRVWYNPATGEREYRPDA
jgi:protein gp37